MTLLVRMVLGFSVIVAVLVGLFTVMVLSLGALRNADGQLAQDAEALSALRTVEIALLREESALNAYVAGADSMWKQQFEDATRKMTDAALAKAGSLSITLPIAGLSGQVSLWRHEAEVDLIALARQPTTEAARARVDQALNEILGALERQMTAAREEKDNLALRMIRMGWSAMAVAFAVALTAAWWLTRSIREPLRKLTTAVDAVAIGHYDVAIAEVDRRDEIGRLARSMDLFREGLSENARLREESEANRKRTAAERTEAVHQVAKDLEDKIASVIRDVAALGATLDQGLSAMNGLLIRSAERSEATVGTAEQTT